MTKPGIRCFGQASSSPARDAKGAKKRGPETFVFGGMKALMPKIQQVNIWVEAEALLDSITDADIALRIVRVRTQGRLIGHMEALGFHLQQEAVLQTLTADVLKSSEIEGEKLDAEQVRSSIARRLVPLYSDSDVFRQKNEVIEGG